jgi:hypothetical protein
MKGREYKLLAWMLFLSLVVGVGIWVFGTVGRGRPPEIDTIWRSVDRIRQEIALKKLALKEGERRETMFLKYRVTITRLKSGDPVRERYLLQYRPDYEWLFTSAWKPSSWDLGLIAFESDSNGRSARVVVSKMGEE